VPLTIKQCLRLALQLEELSDTARLDVEVLLCESLKVSRSYLYTWPEKVLDQGAYDQFCIFLNRRKKGEPVAYITGKKEFWSREFYVAPSTLIPRADTESIIEYVLSSFCSPLAFSDKADIVDSSHIDLSHIDSSQSRRILDLGTGTGALAITLALELPNVVVDAVDLSPDAIKLAKKNASNLHVKNINLFLSDWFESVEHKKYALIVSNPPYIDAEDKHLSEGDVRFEPESALVSQENGLEDIRRIIRESVNYLLPEAKLIIEHGSLQGALVRELFQKNGFSSISTQRDLSGRERLTVGAFVPFD